jgi:hypothetical protein
VAYVEPFPGVTLKFTSFLNTRQSLKGGGWGCGTLRGLVVQQFDVYRLHGATLLASLPTPRSAAVVKGADRYACGRALGEVHVKGKGLKLSLCLIN